MVVVDSPLHSRDSSNLDLVMIRLPVLVWHLVELALVNDSLEDWDTPPVQRFVDGEQRFALTRRGLQILARMFGRPVAKPELGLMSLFALYRRRYLDGDLHRAKETHVYPVIAVANAYRRPIDVVMVVMGLIHKLSRIELNVRRLDLPHEYLRCPDPVETLAEMVAKEDVDRCPKDLWEFWFQIDLSRYPRLTVGLIRYLRSEDLARLRDDDFLSPDPLASLIMHVGLNEDR